MPSPLRYMYFAREVEGLSRRGADRKRRDVTRRRRHPFEHLLRRQDRRDPAEKIARDPDGARGGEQRLPRLGQRLVAADVIGIGARVDDVADRPRRELLDRGHDRAGLRGLPGVHDDDAVLADLDADVGARTGDHEEVRAKLEDL